jgi:hypothetical protein
MAELLLAEFSEPEALARALDSLRCAGVPGLDAHTPFSTEVVREALGPRRTPLSLLVLIGFIAGSAGAYGLEWLLVARLYPLNVGGRPPHFPLAFVPIAFEMGVLGASLTAFVGALVCGKLVRLWDPVFEQPGIESASEHGFWLRLDAHALALAPTDVEDRLRQCGAARVSRLEVPA